MIRSASIAVLLAATPAAQAQTQTLSAAAAEAIVTGCKAHATAKRQSHGIAVVDAGGHLVASLRMDGNGFGIMSFATEKAKAVAAWGFATSGMAEGAASIPGFAQAPYVVTVAGGLPIFTVEGARIGAVGISGEAPADDVACAEAGIRSARLRSTR